MTDELERGACAEHPRQDADRCPVLGVGASAGGLGAFEQFLSAVPPESGLAFVLVSHLSPERESLLADILSRCTVMSVRQARDGTRIEADHVYVAPPEGIVTVSGGALRVEPKSTAARSRLPIDAFLRSLAADYGARAGGVVLSGTGADGTLGLRAIKEAGGVALAQEENTAAFPGMPHSAIVTGLVDFVLPPGEMPQVLVDYFCRAPCTGPVSSESAEELAGFLDRVYDLVRDRTGHDFTPYKKSTILRRIERRMQLAQIAGPDEYVERLRTDGGEIDALFNDLLIGVTQFFRDPPAFEALREEVIAPLVGNSEPGSHLRVWVPGCATGEEAYSIGILLAEEIGRRNARVQVQLFATDVDPQNLSVARAGLYPASIEPDLNAERLARFFVPEDGGFRVGKRVREMLVFSGHDLTSDPPFTRLDLLSCRNVLIYFELELQQRLLPMFHYALNVGGALFLGPSETHGGFDHLFERSASGQKIFRTKPSVSRPPIDLPFTSPNWFVRHRRLVPEPRTARGLEVSRRAERVLLESYAPACVVVDEKDEVVHFLGSTGAYLEAPTGAPDLNVVRMARQGLGHALRWGLREAREDRPVVQKDVRVLTDSGFRFIDLAVRPLTAGHDDPRLTLVVFEEHELEELPRGTEELSGPVLALASAGDVGPEVQELEVELEETRHHLQSTIHELERANEELKSANEEQLSMNEELQSANEELETSKEELQSLNEELATTNSELGLRVEELDRANNDQKNLLTSTQIATLFLSPDLTVRSYTPAAGDLFHLIPTDVGRPIADIRSRLNYDRLVDDALHVLRRLEPVTLEICSEDERWYLVRMLPYRTIDNVIDGVVVTLVDVTVQKAAEAELRRLGTVLRDSNDAVTVQDLSGRILSWNRGAQRMYGYSEAEALGGNIAELVPEGLREELRAVTERVVRGELVEPFETLRVAKDGEVLSVSLMLTLLTGATGRPEAIATTERDITTLTEALREVELRGERFRHIFEHAGVAMLEQDFTAATALLEETGAAGAADLRQRLLDDEDLVRRLAQSVRIVVGNRAALELLGASSEDDLKNAPFEPFLQPEGLIAFASSLAALAAGEREHRSELCVRTLGDRRLDVLCVAAFPPPGGDLRSVLVAMLDVTERSRRQEHALKDRERRLRTIIDSAADGIVVIDERGTIESVNPAAEAMFQRSSAELIGQNVARLMPESYAAEHDGNLRRYLETGEPRIIGIGREVAGLRKDGTTFPIHLSVSEFEDGVRRFTAFLRDLTESKRLEAELRQVQKMEAVGRLASGIAHDFNNLLMGITGCCSMALKELGQESSAAVHIEEIKTAAERASTTTRQLMSFSSRRDVAPDAIFLNTVVEGAETMLRQLVGEDIELSIELAPSGGPILADPGRVEQALLNLVLNSRHALGAGGQLSIRVADVEVDPERARKRVDVEPGLYEVLSVSDTGTGIPEEDQPHVFDPFFTTKSEGEGTGLGLSTVYSIVAQLGGFIELESESGVGTTFRLFFPRVEGAAGAPIASMSADEEGNGETIMVVEDEPLVRKSVMFQLHELGYHVLSAENGEEALRLCAERDEPVGLLLTDIVMPVMGGPELAARLRELQPGIEILYMSAYPGDMLVSEGRIEAGAATIEKPFTPEVLGQRVRELMAQRSRGGQDA